MLHKTQVDNGVTATTPYKSYNIWLFWNARLTLNCIIPVYAFLIESSRDSPILYSNEIKGHIIQ